MATEVLMPRQGQSVESCIIMDWRVKEGDTVSEGDILCEVETDKAAFEVEAPASGTVLGIFYPEDSDVPVLEIIAAIGKPGEDISGLRKDTATEEPEEKEAQIQPSEPAAPSDTPLPSPAGTSKGISPRARKLATAEGIDPTDLSGTGPEGRVIERDVKAALQNRAPLTPAARVKLEAEKLYAPESGSGIGGRVRTADLLPAPLKEEQAAVEFVEISMKGVRKVVAERMLASLQHTAQLTMNASADARQLLAYRKACKSGAEDVSGITINDLVLYATARTLIDFPELNAHCLKDKIVQYKQINLGFAVDTPRGLMVPVIRDAGSQSLKELSVETKRLGAACQDGSINPDLLSGGTFTVTNLGAMGIESFTPVLNAPEVGILGVCNIQPKPIMNSEGGVDFLPHIGLSLTFDHCATDGAPAARFLKSLRDKITTFTLTLAG